MSVISETFTKSDKNNLPKRKVFINEVSKRSDHPPESIESIEDESFDTINLPKLPVKGLKALLWSLASLFLFTVFWNIFELAFSIFAFHWFFGFIFTGFILFIGGTLVRVLWQLFFYQSDIRSLERLRQLAEKMKNSKKTIYKRLFLDELKNFYRGKPQEKKLLATIVSVNDYADDCETIEHLELFFFQPLDQFALDHIRSVSKQTGIAVALSQWIWVDLVIAFYRKLVLIADIAKIYGMRPTLKNQYTIIKWIWSDLAFLNVTDLTMSDALTSIGVSSIPNMLSSSLTQGFGSLVITSRIGSIALMLTRPIPLNKKPKFDWQKALKKLIESIGIKLTKS